MASNFPPGVTEGMIPGNRPEDAEQEYVIELSVSQVDDLKEFVKGIKDGKPKMTSNFILTIEDILFQIEE